MSYFTSIVCCCRSQNRSCRQLQCSEKEWEVHKKRRTVVEGCMTCGQEVLPNCKIYVCGVCNERTTWCQSCHDEKQDFFLSGDPHPIFLETVALEVNVIF